MVKLPPLPGKQCFPVSQTVKMSPRKQWHTQCLPHAEKPCNSRTRRGACKSASAGYAGKGVVETAREPMRGILFEFDLHPTTWVYMSSLMTVGIYFKFRRLWSVRNLDLIALIAFAPGLLLVTHGQEQLGYTWLFSVSGFFLIRLLLDVVMIRRPLLEPNLSASGLTFTGVALLVFLMTRVGTAPVEEGDRAGPQRLEQLLARQESKTDKAELSQHGPGYPLFYLFASFANRAYAPPDTAEPETSRRARIEDRTARTTAILAHLALVIGLVLIGYRHFDSMQTGVAVATLYLLLPYTAQIPSRVDHVLPAALLVWAVAAYRRPLVAGILLGLAAGVIYYPLFLLPLWCGFYWRRGLLRFCLGVLGTLVLLVASLALTASNWHSFVGQLQQMFGWTDLLRGEATGFWQYHDSMFRLPVMAAFLALCGSLALWPPQKNLGTLLSCSAAVMLGTQFWHAQHGGIYMGWYLPLLVLTIFRPNLEDRVAQSAVAELRFRWRRNRAAKAPAVA